MFFLKELPTRQMIEGYARRFDGNGDRIEKALAALRQASLLIRRLDDYFARHGLSQLRFLMLIAIDREPERDWLTVGELRDRLDVSGPVVARTLRVLEEDGLVRVERDEADARQKRISLTRRGRSKLENILEGYFRILEDGSWP